MAERTVPVTTQNEIAEQQEETRAGEAYLQPPVDIYETQDSLVVVVDLPGVEKDQAALNVDKGVLTIEGRTRHLAPGEPVWSEYRLMNFYRRFELPELIDQEKIKAELKNGVLTINLPKAEKAKPKKINVNVG